MHISVIIPVYNVEKYVSLCVHSLLKQTFRDFDIILGNDGSPDRSAEIAEELLSAQHEIPFQIITTVNRGVSAARNTGFEKAQGQHVVFVDADDVLSPHFLESFHRTAQELPSKNIYSCGFSVVDESGAETFAEETEQRECLTYAEAQEAFFERRIKFLLPALMLRTSFLRENGIRFDEAVRYSEDVQFIWRCLAYNREAVSHINARYYNYVLHAGSTMTASGIEKILTFCGGMDRLDKETHDLFCEPVKSQMTTRMYFSMLHGAAKMLCYRDFKVLYESSNCRQYIVKQTMEGRLIPRIVALLLLISRRLGYEITRRF